MDFDEENEKPIMEKKVVITLSRVFQGNHSRKGEPTLFRDAFNAGQVFNRGSECLYKRPKKHTIRANYLLWERRISDIQAGRAVLSVRQWAGKPYRSKQVEIARLTANDGIGIQKLQFYDDKDGVSSLRFFVDGKFIEREALANNDGLSKEDWQEWFRGYDLSKPLAIIHFTKFRY